MRNENIKMRWIQEKENTGVKLAPGALFRALKKMEDFEERFDKDIYEFNLFDIYETYGTLNFVSVEVLAVHNSYMSQYVQFCIDNNISDNEVNHFEEITPEIMRRLSDTNIQKLRVLTRKDVLAMISRLTYYIDKFVILAFFEGLNGEYYSDITKLKIQDIDVENNTFNLERGKIKVSKELVAIAIEAYHEKNYSRVDGEGKIAHPYIESEYIFKEFKQSRSNEQKNQGRRVQVKTNKIFEYLGIEKYMSISALINSGRIHWLKENYTPEEIEGIFYKTNTTTKIEAKEKFEYQFDTITRRTWYRKFSGFLE